MCALEFLTGKRSRHQKTHESQDNPAMMTTASGTQYVHATDNGFEYGNVEQSFRVTFGGILP